MLAPFCQSILTFEQIYRSSQNKYYRYVFKYVYFSNKKKMLSLIKNGMVLSSFRMEVFAPPKPSRIHVKIFIALGKREISNLNIGKTFYRAPLRKLLHTTPISTISEVLLNKKQIYSLFSN